MEYAIANYQRRYDAAVAALPELRARQGGPFAQQDELDAKNARLEVVIRELSNGGTSAARNVVERTNPLRRPDGSFRRQAPDKLMFSRARIDTDAPLVNIFSQIATDDAAFRMPDSNAKTLAGILADMAPTLSVDEFVGEGDLEDAAAPVDRAWHITSPTGEQASVYRNNRNKEIWLDISNWKEGRTGSGVYQAVATLAHNTGHVFIGDPAGLSDKALYRRTEHMISSALRHGTTKHLAPHARQVEATGTAGGADVRPIDWQDGDDAHNLQEMLVSSYTNILHLFPEIADVTYNFARARFERAPVRASAGPLRADQSDLGEWSDEQGLGPAYGGSTSGRGTDRADERTRDVGRVDAVPFTDEDFSAAAKSVRSAYDLFFPSGGGAYTPPVGVSDLKRAVLTQSVLQEAGRDGGREVLDHVSERLLQRVSPQLARLLYSRDAEYFRADGVSSLPTLPPGADGGTTAPLELSGVDFLRAMKATEQLNRELAKADMAPVRALRTAPNAQFALARQVGKALGIEVNFVSKNAEFEGVAYNGVAYLTEGMRNAELAIAGHETLHALEQSNPELGAKLRTQIRAYLKEGVVEDRQAREFAANGFQDVTEDQAEAEVIADINGSMWMDPIFWSDLAKADRSLFRSVAYKFMEVAAKLIKSLRGSRFDVTALVRDVEAVRAIMVATWAENNATRDAAAPAPVVRRAMRETSVALPSAKWLADEVIAKEVENRIGKFEHQPVVRIRDSAFGVLPGVASDEHVSGAVYEGVIYLFRDALPTLREVQRTLFHEMLHYGLQRFLPGDEYIIRMNMIYQRDGAFRAETDRWVKTGQGQLALKQGGQKYATARGIDEALAVLAEPNAGAFTRTDVRAKVERTVQRWLANLAEWLGMPEAAAYWRGMKNEEARALIQQIFRKTATDFPPADPWAGTGSAALRKGKPASSGAAAPASSSAFKAWFDDSKIVNDDGTPMVVYHGTSADIRVFKASAGWYGRGIYFAHDPAWASEFAEESGLDNDGGDNVVPAYLSLQRPFLFRDNANGEASNIQLMRELGISERKINKAIGADNNAADVITAALEGMGHDGLIVMSRDGNEYMALYPQQIKSAVGNSGEFDGGSPDIAFSRAGLGNALASAANSIAEVRLPANYLVGDLFNSTGKLSWWHKSIGTMDNLAKRQPAFAAVYGAVQRFLGDVSRYAVVAADLAPTLLPKLENVTDIVGKNRKKALTAADTKAIGAPIFEGTLTWARDAHGKPVKIDMLEEQAEAMSTADKARILLKKGIIDDQQNRAWQHNPLDIYDSIINSRFKNTQLRAGVVWSDTELRSMFSLSVDQIALYRQFRAALDKSLTNLTISEMVKMGGKDAKGMLEQAVAAPDLPAAAALLRDHFIALAKLDPEKMDMHLDTARQIMNLSDKGKDLMDRGYAPLSRFGKHTVYVREGEEQVYFGMFETQYEASKMARDMRAEHPDAQISHGTVSADAYKLFAGVSPETIELFGSMVGLDSQADAASTEVYQTYLKLAKNNRSSMKRMIQRKGIAGFSEDAGRVLAGFIYSNARLTAGNAHLGEIDEAITEIPKQQGELTDAAMQLREHIRNPEAGAPLGGLMFAQFLGGSVASAMVNLTQPFTMTLPYLSQFGGLTKAGARLAAAVKDAGKDATGDAQLDAAMQWAIEEGIVAPQEVHYLQAQASGKGALRAGDGTKGGNTRAHLNNAMAKVTLGWGKLFAMAELANRRITFIAAYRTAVDEGLADPTKFAQEAVAQTQGTYNSGNKPKWARGVVGSLLMTFKQYSIGYLELLSRMAFAGAPGSKERAAGRRAALYMLAVLLLMGGADGLPFEQDLEDAIDGILQRLGYNFSSKRSKQAFLTDTLGQGGADFVLKGVSSMPGMPIDVAGRFGMGNLIPGTGLLTKKDSYTRDLGELAGPAGDLAKRTFTGTGKLLGGDLAGAVLDITPAAVRNVVKGADMLATGAYRDARGYNVNETSAPEAGMKMIGFQPNSTADVQDAKGQALNMVGQNRMRSMEIAEHWAQGLADGDMAKVEEARAWRDDWNAKNPATPMRVSMPGVIKRVKAMRQDSLNRTQKTAPVALKQTVRRELAEIRAE
ncbi:PLxRFG domain-containing protein [Massilia sp. CCM 8734]|uniref:PLxRFG domain-containing protein n=1 Tax=Massilia sp. CCM 8734 TaxID=2609283 RepID=UPI00142213FA|nr:PLxRFG domain-containing protein [Massilia sp. CCM 8734]